MSAVTGRTGPESDTKTGTGTLRPRVDPPARSAAAFLDIDHDGRADTEQRHGRHS